MDAPTEAAREARFPKWAAALTDHDAFQQEQARLGRIWTFLGLTLDVAKDGDWFTADLGGRSVFVQRFGDQLKGFENRCAHRFYPLRTKEKGNGPIKCGFHHWEYDEEGRAVVVPRCKDLFGVMPKQLNARIAPIEIATCGSLVFGRFQHPHANESLNQFLGEAAPIIETMCTLTRRPRSVSVAIEANWKLCYHISLDDYHSPAVHPTTFGMGGYLSRGALRYFRFGAHNAFFPGGDENALQTMIQECKDGTYRPVRYRIFQIFPNVLIALFRGQYLRAKGRQPRHWYVNVQQYVPIAPGRSFLRSWFYRAPFDAGGGPFERLYASLTEPVRAPVVEYFIRKLHSEDNEVVERLQKFASQQSGWPRVGYAEERIKWFEEAYAKALAD
jgi:phenylpropionate dioxygenase-like ring-hydroxylating dioxygenase large terminal subunit